TVIVPPRLKAVLAAVPFATASIRTPSAPSATRATTRRSCVGVARVLIAPLSGGFSAGSRVECVAYAVAQEVESEHRQEQRDPWEREEPPGGVEDRRRLGEHLAPARLRRADADTEIRQRRLEQNVLRDHERRVDDDRSDEVREDLAEEDCPVPGATRPRRFHELLLPDREHLPADDAADVCPAGDHPCRDA